MRTLALLLLLSVHLLCAGQDIWNLPARPPRPPQRFRIDVGAGFGATQNEFKQHIDASQVQDHMPYGPYSFTWPSIHVEGEYAVSRELSLGVHYDFWQDERWYKISNDMAVHHNTINTWMVSARQYWNGRDHGVSFYSGLMAGAAFEHFHQYKITDLPSQDVTRFAVQCTLLGVRFGKRAGISTELGLGNKCLFSVGLSLAW